MGGYSDQRRRGNPHSLKGGRMGGAKRAPSDSLTAVLALSVKTDQHVLRFMDALTDLVRWPSERKAVPEADLPDAVRMIIGLRGLWLAVSTDGMWKYLEGWGAGTEFHRLQEWIVEIGAARAGEYLLATAAVFPASRVIVDDEQRRDYVAALNDRDPDPLEALDQRFKGAVDEIPALLQSYLRAHSNEVESWLASWRTS